MYINVPESGVRANLDLALKVNSFLKMTLSNNIAADCLLSKGSRCCLVLGQGLTTFSYALT